MLSIFSWYTQLTIKTEFRLYVLLPLAANDFIAPLLNIQSKIKEDS